VVLLLLGGMCCCSWVKCSWVEGTCRTCEGGGITNCGGLFLCTDSAAYDDAQSARMVIPNALHLIVNTGSCKTSACVIQVCMSSLRIPATNPSKTMSPCCFQPDDTSTYSVLPSRVFSVGEGALTSVGGREWLEP
jgi:hypothetical protein